MFQNVVLFINNRFFTANQNDCVFIIQAPHLVRCHKLAPSLLEILTERTVPALTLAGCPGINRFFPKQFRNVFVRALLIAAKIDEAVCVADDSLPIVLEQRLELRNVLQNDG